MCMIDPGWDGLKKYSLQIMALYYVQFLRNSKLRFGIAQRIDIFTGITQTGGFYAV